MDDRTDDTLTDSHQLIQLLGALPLAMDSAFAYIRATHCSIRHYINMFNSQQNRRLLMSSTDVKMSTSGYHVSKAWSLSFQDLYDRSPRASALFNILVFLDGTGVPEKLLQTGLDESLLQDLPEQVKFDYCDLIINTIKSRWSRYRYYVLSLYFVYELRSRVGSNLPPGYSPSHLPSLPPVFSAGRPSNLSSRPLG
jgi:hypothetical protein